MDFQHVVADDELRTELLDRIDELTVASEGLGGESLEGLEGGPGAFGEVAPSTMEVAVRRSSAASQAARTKSKSNAVWSSSGRR